MSAIIPFQFESHAVRVQLDAAGEPWFNANDVCAALELGNARQALETPVDPDDVQKELRMLFSAHGIGLIKLDTENPVDSQVLIPARERDEIDWDMANRLATENKDFLGFVKLVKQFYQTGEARAADWDLPTATD